MKLSSLCRTSKRTPLLVLAVLTLAGLSALACGSGDRRAAATVISDAAAPQLTAFGFTPGIVGASDSTQTITVSAHLVDDTGTGSGPGPYSAATFRSPSGGQSINAVFNAEQRSAGTPIDAQYEVSVMIPAHAEEGAWSVAYIDLVDVLGNATRLITADVRARGFPTTLTLTSEEVDTTPPHLEAFDISPKTVDVTSPDPRVTVTARVADDLSGLYYFSLSFVSPSFRQHAQVLLYGTLGRVSGTLQDGVFQGVASLPAPAEPGTWKIELSALRDQAGNSVTLRAADYVALGFPGSFTAAGPAAVPPIQRTITATDTGLFCFTYVGPATSVSSFATFFAAGIRAVHRLNLPAGDFSSWFLAAPSLATIASLSNGDLVCVAGPPGTNVFV